MEINDKFTNRLQIVLILLSLVSYLKTAQSDPTTVRLLSQPAQMISSYRVQTDDTIWSMANRFRPDPSVSVEQMMLALVRENPEAFIEDNINGVKRGYILRMPDRNSITSIDKQQALAQVREHAILWRQYRETLSGVAPASSLEADSDRVTADEVTDADGQLSIVSASEAGGSETVSSGQDQKAKELNRLRNELSLARETLESERQQSKSLRISLADLDQRVQNVVQMDDSELSKLQQDLQVSSWVREAAKPSKVNNTVVGTVVSDKSPASVQYLVVSSIESESAQDESMSADEFTSNELPSDELQQANENNFDRYSVVLKADKKIIMPGLPGNLFVWIGDQNYKPNPSDDMVYDETTIVAVGSWAIIEPFSTAFEINPVKSGCIKIHSTGSEEPFELTPKKEGVFEVRAKVNLYGSNDCSDSPVPKSATTLKVTVEVDNVEVFVGKINELGVILWNKLLEFWEAFLVVTFGLFIFLYKDKLKKLFGFDADKT